jgi:hypothetical protein
MSLFILLKLGDVALYRVPRHALYRQTFAGFALRAVREMRSNWDFLKPLRWGDVRECYHDDPQLAERVDVRDADTAQTRDFERPVFR